MAVAKPALLGAIGLLQLACTISNPAFDTDDRGAGSDDSGQALTGSGGSGGSGTDSGETGGPSEGSDEEVAPSTGKDTDLDGSDTSGCPDECGLNAACDDEGVCKCVDGWAGDGLVCARLVPEILRVELGCEDDDDCVDGACPVAENDRAEGKLEGDSERVFAVTLQVRGVVEFKTYLGGDTDPPFNVGGEPADDPWNVYSLHPSEPPRLVHLNAGLSGGQFCAAIDEVITIDMRGEASLVLEAWSGGDACGILNVDARGEPIAFEGMSPFDGQFLEVYVIGIQPKDI